MPEARVGMDAEGLVTEWDDGAELLFGYSREQALARYVAELIVPPRAASGPHPRAVARGFRR